jgi:hypothetical protein
VLSADQHCSKRRAQSPSEAVAAPPSPTAQSCNGSIPQLIRSMATMPPSSSGDGHAVDAVLGETALFVRAVASGLLERHGIDGSRFEMDHVCFRCSSDDE